MATLKDIYSGIRAKYEAGEPNSPVARINDQRAMTELQEVMNRPEIHFGTLEQETGELMDYATILNALKSKAIDDIARWTAYCIKHPRKSKGKAKPTFYQSLANQLETWIDASDKSHPVPFSEKQAYYVNKACPGAYDFIREQQVATGQYQNHGPKCPVRYNLNGLGLEIGESGLVTCQGCGAVLGKVVELQIA